MQRASEPPYADVEGSLALAAPRVTGDNAASATGDAPRAEPRWRRGDQRILNALVVLLVLTQRIGIPLGDTSVGIALPIGYAAAGLLIARGSVTASRLRAELLGMALAACLALSAVINLRGGVFSFTSLLLLLAIYALWPIRATGDAGGAAVRGAGRAFVHVMLVVATIGILQFTTQLAGIWRFQDYLTDWVPRKLLVAGFNTTYPISFGSPTLKSNGLLLLEPSFLSQFCALAIVIGLILRVRAWQLLILTAGLASAVSGTGVVLMIGSSILMLLRAPRAIRPAYVATFAATLVIVLLSPVASLLLDRTGEISSPTSSGYSRFVAPYAEVLQGLAADPIRYAIGSGPGMAVRLLSRGLGTANFSTAPKLLFEYGLFAGGLFMLFLLVSMLDRGPWRVVPGSLVILTFFLQGALLSPQTMLLAWALTGFGSRDDDSGTGPIIPWRLTFPAALPHSLRSWSEGRSAEPLPSRSSGTPVADADSATEGSSPPA